MNPGVIPLLIDAKGERSLLWEPKVDAAWARIIVSRLDNAGLDSRAALRKVGIPEKEIFNEDGRVPVFKCDALFDYAAKITGDDLFGLKLGIDADPRDLGLLAYVGLSSPTLADAIQNLARYVQVFTDQFVLRSERKPDGLMLHAIVDGPADYTALQANEAGLIGLLVTYRLFSARSITPLEVHFKHSRRANLAAFRQAFGCRVFFESETTGLLLKYHDLDIPLASSDDKLLRVLRSYCEDILAKRKHNEPPFLSEVSSHIVDQLPKGHANAKVVASRMGVSQRTFMRRLHEAGTSFQELTDSLRMELAETYLRDPRLSSKEIAFLLGYSSSSAFNHGFKRLEGKSPGEFRTSLA